MLYALADSFGSVSQCSIFVDTTQANVKHKAHSVFFFWTNRAQFATCALTARWWPESSPLAPAPATVNPEYFVCTKFLYAGDLWPFVRMKFLYSRWPLRILWLALSFSYAFYFRTEAAMFEILPWPKKRDSRAHVAQALDLSSMHAPMFGLRACLNFLARVVYRPY